jgi:hypothetical protein
MENQKKYYCEFCKYTTDYPSDWIKHGETLKHKRLGERKSTKCDLCDYESSSHWNIKIHKLSQHSTIEERKTHKFYCISCDQVFFSKFHFDKHNSGIRHNNILKIKDIK